MQFIITKLYFLRVKITKKNLHFSLLKTLIENFKIFFGIRCNMIKFAYLLNALHVKCYRINPSNALFY